MRTGELGFWWRSLGGPPAPRAALPGPLDVDVAIVGAGFTGLWTAYYLKRAAPHLSVVVLEAETAGFGAAGRNGGWVTGFFSGPARVYERHAASEGYMALQREMFATVQEIGRVLAEHSIDADFAADGRLTVAIGPAQERRQHERLAHSRRLGLGEQDLRELSPAELGERVQIAGASGALYSPHAARVHPAKLVRGLASAVERLGVPVYEQTPVSRIVPHRAHTHRGDVTARWVVRATEGYTASIAGLARALVPMNSSMVITEPLGQSSWDAIGWSGSEVLSDGAHVYAYLQRTADGRVAIGGRGAPYRFGSRTDARGSTAQATVAGLRAKLAELFPALAGTPLAHAWSGVLGVPRDWCVSVDADPQTGLAWAGGYVGEGVAAANLAARTLRDLILERSSPLVGLPWVGRAPRRWEPEPLRWAGIHAVYWLYRRADDAERRSGRPSRLGALVDSASGRE
jgi:glycine/D-amino acid oxidase-like deaminating enzyme